MTKTNKPAFKLISGSGAIKAAIDSIARRGKKLDRDIQVAALSAMQHHVEHGDVTLINRLVDSMPKGSRVNALRAFIETFGAVRYDTESKNFLHIKGATFRLDDAMQIMWSEFKPEAAYQPITDPFKRFDQLVGQFEKDMAEMGDASKVTPEMISALKSAKAEAIEAGILH
jgi:hypothetical protein